MGLVQVATETVTSAVASVTLTGINSDDVYMCAFNNVAPTTDNTYPYIRVTVSGTPDTSANYDRASKGFRTAGAFSNQSNTNETFSYISGNQLGTNTSEVANGILYLFNFNNSSEYSFVTLESTTLNSSSALYGLQGGFVNTNVQSCDGVQFYQASGNIASGTFTLYRVV